jgi:hypothetical protein
VRDLFDDFDADASGSIDKGELYDLVEMLGTRLSEDELRAAMDKMDGDGSGEVEFDELFRWWIEPETASARSKARERWSSGRRRLTRWTRTARASSSSTRSVAGHSNLAERQYVPERNQESVRVPLI